MTRHFSNIEIRTFQGLAVDFVREQRARVMIRGVRPITDIAAELTMMMANRRLVPDIETLFMIADGELAIVSSSLIKQIAGLATEEELAKISRAERGAGSGAINWRGKRESARNPALPDRIGQCGGVPPLGGVPACTA